MKCNPEGLAIIRVFEGCKLNAYRCPAGILSVGFGHTGPDVTEGMTITQAHADDLLVADVSRFETSVKQCVAAPLNENQFSALVCFAYNVKGWRTSTLIQKVNQEDYDGAAEEFPKWVHAAGQVLPGLVKRREKEQELFLTPC